MQARNLTVTNSSRSAWQHRGVDQHPQRTSLGWWQCTATRTGDNGQSCSVTSAMVSSMVSQNGTGVIFLCHILSMKTKSTLFCVVLFCFGGMCWLGVFFVYLFVGGVFVFNWKTFQIIQFPEKYGVCPNLYCFLCSYSVHICWISDVISLLENACPLLSTSLLFLSALMRDFLLTLLDYQHLSANS